jgi:hypothetical protein
MNKEQLLQLLNKHHLEWVVGFEDMFDFINDVYQCGYNEAIKQ